MYAVLCRLNPSTKPGLSLRFLYEKEGGSGLGMEGSFHHTMESIAVVFITISITTFSSLSCLSDSMPWLFIHTDISTQLELPFSFDLWITFHCTAKASSSLGVASTALKV